MPAFVLLNNSSMHCVNFLKLKSFGVLPFVFGLFSWLCSIFWIQKLRFVILSRWCKQTIVFLKDCLSISFHKCVINSN